MNRTENDFLADVRATALRAVPPSRLDPASVLADARRSRTRLTAVRSVGTTAALALAVTGAMAWSGPGGETSPAGAPGGSPVLESVTLDAVTSDQVYAVVDCLGDLGWDVDIVDEPPLTLDLLGGTPNEQLDRFHDDLAACNAQVHAPGLEITQENAAAYYEGLLSTRTCLAGLGYPVPDPADREASIASMLQARDTGIIDPLWSPFDLIAGDEATLPMLGEAMTACPHPEWGAR